jgi:hypothetical protein
MMLYANRHTSKPPIKTWVVAHAYEFVTNWNNGMQKKRFIPEISISRPYSGSLKMLVWSSNILD